MKLKNLSVVQSILWAAIKIVLCLITKNVNLCRRYRFELQSKPMWLFQTIIVFCEYLKILISRTYLIDFESLKDFIEVIQTIEDW